MAKDILKRLKEEILIFDGATGTMLQKAGLKGGECPEEWNISKPEVVKKVHRSYVEAGSQVVTANTFGANRVKLKEYGLENDVERLNIEAARIAREAAMGEALVAASVGPTGKFIEPVGDLTFEEAYAIFKEQGSALEKGGVDIILIETMIDLKETKAAIIAMKENTSLPVFATMTFEENMRSLLGTPPEAFAVVAKSLGVTAVGANCSLGVEGIYRALERMRQVVDLPLIANPNAGIPFLKGGKTVFPATPEEIAEWVPSLLDIGVKVTGGCCGTTPQHIKRIGDEVREYTSKHAPAEPAPYLIRGIKQGKEITTVYKPLKGGFLASRSSYVIFGEGNPPLVIGERINPTGRKTLSQEIRDGKTVFIRKEAKGQVEAGVDLLDLNIGLPDIDEPSFMKKAVFAVNENVSVPVVLDSSNLKALEEGLKAVDGKALINSVNGKEGSLSTILPLAKKYGASVIGLTLDGDGIPPTAEGRFKIAERILKRVLGYGIQKEDLIIDCLALTVSASPDGARETLKAIRMVKERLGLSTSLGVSNVSFGLPRREVINASFLSMALEAGLDMAIVNPYNKMVMDAYCASILLKGFDPGAERYISRCSLELKVQGSELKAKEEPKTIAGRLKRAVIEGEKAQIKGLVEEAIKEGWQPLKISNEALIPGLEEVGRRFDKNLYFLPQVMLSAETMKTAFEVLKERLKGDMGPKLGRILMATVEGDVHDIGKNIVSTLLENHGFEVIDLGKNVPADRILNEAIKHKVDVVGLSALMTTTVMEMGRVIKLLQSKGIKTFTVVGGAVVTQEFSDSIGADCYAKDAMDAVKKLKALMEKSKSKGQNVNKN